MFVENDLSNMACSPVTISQGFLYFMLLSLSVPLTAEKMIYVYTKDALACTRNIFA